MKKNTKLNVFSGAVGTVLGTGVGYALNSGDCFTTAVVAACGCAIGSLASFEINHNIKLKKLEEQIILSSEYDEEKAAKNEKVLKLKRELDLEKQNAETSRYFDRIGYCFKAGTLVLTDSGYKNIEDIVESDLVYSYNMETKTRELKKVVRTFINEGKEMLDIIVNGARMELTSNHTCFVNGDWVLASDVKAGDQMLDCDGHDLVVENVETANSCDKVYNFEVEDNHNYFVTNLNILVHNDSSLGNF